MTKSVSRGFDGHLISQACGAINDNLFRNTFAFIATAGSLSIFGMEAAPALGLVFMLGMLLFQPLGGYFADHLPMHLYIRTLRCSETLLVLCGIGALSLHNLPLMLLSLFALGAQSGLYGPAKYAIIPLLVADKDLAKANGQIQAWTTISIITGIILTAALDPTLIATSPLHNFSMLSIMAVLGLSIAGLGIISAFRIHALPPQNTTVRLADMWNLRQYQEVLNQGFRLRQVIAGISGVWFVGAFLIAVLPDIVTNLYGLGQAQFALMNACLLLGTAVSSLLAPTFHTRSHPGAVPCLGGVLLCVGAYILASACAVAHCATGILSMRELYQHSSVSMFMLGLFICGVGFGFLVVPLNTLLQQRSNDDQRGQLFAVCGMIGSCAMLGGFAAAMVLSSFFSKADSLYIMCALICAITATACFCYRYQLAVLPFIWLQRIFYKVTVTGSEHVPITGGCLIVCNHVSYSDGIILGSNMPRHTKFLVYDTFTKMPVIGFFLRAIGVIPIDGAGKRQALVSSITAAVAAAQAGAAVVIFPEGKLSRSGQLDSFQRGMERIAQRAGVPIIPAYLDGLYGTVSSRAANKKSIRPRRPVRLCIGAPLPSDTSASDARNAVLALQYDNAVAHSMNDTRTLGQAFLNAARRHPFKTAVYEAAGSISYLKAAACARSINRACAFADDQAHIGILLPPGRGGALANIALAIDGRCAVNLNHTVGEKNLTHMCDSADIRTLISSRLYLRHIKIDAASLSTAERPVRMIYIEDILKNLTPLTVIARMCSTLLLPSRWLCRRNSNADDVAAIIFSSGSTGTPKGVQLTHRQFLANGAAAFQHLNVNPRHACILCPLPLFHSFGLGVGIWLPLAHGLTCALQADPRDGAAISALCATSQATIMVSTPTFIRSYMRRMNPTDLRSLRMAIVGAEKCPADIRSTFKEKFDADLLEGYGCTELCPLVASNISDTHIDGVHETGSRDGSIGRVIPGIDAFTVDIDTLQRLPAGDTGLLVIRSPARMKGYLHQEALSDSVFIHGGYNTGDIVRIDADGFIFITGRLSRFAKIGGEMVPLDNVQEALQQHCDTCIANSDTDSADNDNNTDCQLAVAAIPDDTRGERLIVMHTGIPCTNDELLHALNDFPAIFKPKIRDIHQVPSIPILGTGKMDLRGVSELAKSLG